MPYVTTVENLSQKNLFEYNSAKIFAEVSEAMAKEGDARDKALQEVLKRNYLADAEKYEPMRKQLLFQLRGMSANEASRMSDAITNMSGSYSFLEEYATIISEMAKDIDGSYKPKFLLGLTANETKNLASGFLSSYSRYEEAKFMVENTAWNYAMQNVEGVGFNSVNNEVRKYKTSDEDTQGQMKELYIHKKIVSEKLDSKGFFWKLFNRKETKAMRTYINAVNQALKDIEFPESAEKEAEVEFLSQSAALETEYKATHMQIEDIFKSAEGERVANGNDKEKISLHELDEKQNEVNKDLSPRVNPTAEKNKDLNNSIQLKS